MKRYNKCILRENAKLRSIYNTLIRESSDTNECDDINEENDIEIKEKDIDKADDIHETEVGRKIPTEVGQKMSVAEFLGECDKETKDLTENNKNEETNEQDLKEENLMTAEEFFAGTAQKKSDEKEITAESFFAEEELEEKDIETEELEEEEELEEKDSGDDEEAGDDEDDEDDEEAGDDEEEEAGDEDEEEAGDEDEELEEEEQLIAKKHFYATNENDKEKELSESLKKHYRNANRKLFNF